MGNTIRFDWAIKRLLRNKANFGILEGFLSELLDDDIKIESILERESNKQTEENKMNRVDLLVRDARSELIIIEVQSNYSHDYLMRILFGTSKLIVDNMDKGMEYAQIKKVISVNIVYFDLGHGEDYIYHGATRFTGLYKKDILGLSPQEQIVMQAEQIENIYPEYYIIKVNKFDNVAKNTLDEWINFLKNEEVKEGTKAKGLVEAKEKLNVLKLSKQEMTEYESDLDAWRDYASSMSTNFLSGQLDKQMEIARNCLADGISIELTAKLTGLPEKIIRNLSSKL